MESYNGADDPVSNKVIDRALRSLRYAVRWKDLGLERTWRKIINPLLYVVYRPHEVC